MKESSLEWSFREFFVFGWGKGHAIWWSSTRYTLVQLRFSYFLCWVWLPENVIVWYVVLYMWNERIGWTDLVVCWTFHHELFNGIEGVVSHFGLVFFLFTKNSFVFRSSESLVLYRVRRSPTVVSGRFWRTLSGRNRSNPLCVCKSDMVEVAGFRQKVYDRIW
jgi:hypothetical protein